MYLYLANKSNNEAWQNVIKQYNLLGPNIVHYNLPEEQQRAIERFLKVHSYPYYKLIGRDGQVIDLNADARELVELVRLLDQIK